MDVKKPLPPADDGTGADADADADAADNVSLTTSMPELTPTHSIASSVAMDMHDQQHHDQGGDEPPPYSAVLSSSSSHAAQPDQPQVAQVPQVPQVPPPRQAPEEPPQLPQLPQLPPRPDASSLPPAPAEATLQWSSRDPRSSSMQSLLPETLHHGDRRRRLLLVYVHGFMGDETSFQSFPSHVHNLLVILLAESHVVHTKVYPRYRSRRAISTAAEDLSKWLTPHDNADTDIILIGHSMGGLVTAEVVLLPPHPAQYASGPLRHHILGTLNFDVPFLGMHPGMIPSGISSIFRPYPNPTPAAASANANTIPTADSSTSLQLSQTSSSSASLSSAATANTATPGGNGIFDQPPSDPNYNPKFYNDVRLPQRSTLQSAAHFLAKHSRNLGHAAIQVVTQHFEFGSCMYDFEGLKVRYSRVRMLEDENPRARATVVQSRTAPPRVRFTNYYTASTGRPKKAAAPAPPSDVDTAKEPAEPEAVPTYPTSEEDGKVRDASAPFDTSSLPPDYSDIDFTSDSEEGDIDRLTDLDPMVTPTRSETAFSDTSSEVSDTAELPLPQLPLPPVFRPPLKPPFTKEAYKTAIKTYKEEVKEYHRSIRSYHEQMQAYRKQEMKRLKLVRQKSAESVASSIDSRRASLLALHEKRKVEYNDRRAMLNARLEKAKEDRRQMIELLRPKREPPKDTPAMLSKCIEHKVGRVERRAERREQRSAHRDERRLAKAVAKEDRKRAKAESKSLRKGLLSPPASTRAGSPSVAGSESLSGDVMWDHEEDEDEDDDDDSKSAVGSVASSIRKEPSLSSTTKPLAPTRAPPAVPQSPSPQPSQTSVVSPPPAAVRPAPPPPSTTASGKGQLDEKGKPKKDRKFCLLPPKDSTGGRDPAWVRVYMENVDEVGAHCGLFFPRGPDGTERTDTDVLEAGAVAAGSWSERYARLVGDVADRIEGWVHEELTRRLVSGELGGHD